MFFKCYFQQRELIALQSYLPHDEFCIFNVPGEKFYYGVMNEELHSKFMDILSGETLEQLEYLDEKDFINTGRQSMAEIMGNEGHLKKLLN